MNLDQMRNHKNIAEMLKEEELARIGADVVTGYEVDEDSRKDWKEVVDKAMEIAKQIMTPKNFPWPNASNIKFPLITQASIDYASRTLPEIIQNDKVVKAVIVGMDTDEAKARRAARVSQYMSYQLTTKSADWEDGTDKLIQILPVLGTVFKKTYYNFSEKTVVSELCNPDCVVVNYKTPCLETARRITHKLCLSTNDVIERQRRGMFLDVDLVQLTPELEDTPREIDHYLHLLEQHCYLDLDKDGYKEPYIVTVHKDTGKVLRIVARYADIEYNDKKQVVRIEPEHYFTDFHFIRSPDGGFYSQGFGSLLLPINTAINTLINQLIDSGTISNTQGGFLGRGLRLKNGEFKFKMGEWKVLDTASGTDLKANVYPLPVREPSQTLYQLLGLLMQVGKDLSSTTDVMHGSQPAQNVASNTIAQLVEQGTKVFVAINKRLYRALRNEYQKIYELNYKFLTQKEYTNVIDDPEANVKKDFNISDMGVFPVADPSVSSENQRIQRASMIMQLRTVDHREADRYLLETMQLDKSNIEKLLPAPDPNAPPPPEVQKVMAEIQAIQANIAKVTADATLAAQAMELERAKVIKATEEADSRIYESAARIQKMQEDAAHGQARVLLLAEKTKNDAENAKATLAVKADSTAAEAVLRHMELTNASDKNAADSLLAHMAIEKDIALAAKTKQDQGVDNED